LPCELQITQLHVHVDQCAAFAVRGNQGRLRVQRFEIVQYRGRLEQHQVVIDQRRHATVGIQAQVLRLAMLASRQVDEHFLAGNVLFLERDPHAPCERGKRMRVQLEHECLLEKGTDLISLP
jgi:hypothetical protein